MEKDESQEDVLVEWPLFDYTKDGHYFHAFLNRETGKLVWVETLPGVVAPKKQ